MPTPRSDFRSAHRLGSRLTPEGPSDSDSPQPRGRSAASTGYSSWPLRIGHTWSSQLQAPNSETMMRFYNQQHRFYCGVDLHARTLSLHILDATGKTVFAKTIAASPDAFLAAVAPFRDGLAVAAECMFAWYWLADLCHDQQIPFVLGHALYMKA